MASRLNIFLELAEGAGKLVPQFRKALKESVERMEAHRSDMAAGRAGRDARTAAEAPRHATEAAEETARAAARGTPAEGMHAAFDDMEAAAARAGTVDNPLWTMLRKLAFKNRDEVKNTMHDVRASKKNAGQARGDRQESIDAGNRFAQQARDLRARGDIAGAERAAIQAKGAYSQAISKGADARTYDGLARQHSGLAWAQSAAQKGRYLLIAAGLGLATYPISKLIQEPLRALSASLAAGSMKGKLDGPLNNIVSGINNRARSANITLRDETPTLKHDSSVYTNGTHVDVNRHKILTAQGAQGRLRINASVAAENVPAGQYKGMGNVDSSGQVVMTLTTPKGKTDVPLRNLMLDIINQHAGTSAQFRSNCLKAVQPGSSVVDPATGARCQFKTEDNKDIIEVRARKPLVTVARPINPGRG